VEATLPEVVAACRATLRLVLRDGAGTGRATAEVPFAIIPRESADSDPAAIADRAGVTITDHLDREALDRVRAGARIVVLATDVAAIDADVELPAPLRLHRRTAAHPDRPAAGAVWQGDWITTFAWAVTHGLRDLTAGRCLDLSFERVLPELVIAGDGAALDPGIVTAGLFAGWVHAPAAFTVAMDVGAGRLVVTTLRLEADNGPLAHAMLADLVRSAATPDHAGMTPEAGPAP
jgi:hypothetical protein